MKIAGLIPAYNASKTIAGIVERIPFELLDWLIIVNDGSTDSTRHVLSEIKTPIPLILLDHPRNLGYGAAQKTLFSKALSIPECDGAVIFHADGGHYPEELSILLKPLLTGKAELVVGSRTLGILHESKPLMGSKHLGAVFLGPMPGYKFIFNKLLTMVQNLCYGT
ncbi:MAG: glycosyltransferase family 2 protein, partial [Bdellovibrionales bacterium]|nr:glycosyltransferase family 2 protein [Bdellovibrionales bacterium]